jgi:ketosteroid isomerase-like protein
LSRLRRSACSHSNDEGFALAIRHTPAVKGRLDPTAVAKTSEQARTARNLVDRTAASFPWIQRVGITVTVRLPARIRTLLYRDAHRRVFAWFNRRDWELNTLAMDPERFTITSGDPQRWQLPGPRDTYRGVGGFLELQDAWMEVWGDLRLTLDGVVDAGHGRVVVLFRQSGSAAASGVALEEPIAMINEFARGWLVRQTYWRDQEAALRSVERR